MKLILTMAGEYTRFINFSSAIPKYLLPIKKGVVLDAVLKPYVEANLFEQVVLICNEKDKKFHNIVEEKLKYFSSAKTKLTYIKNSASQVDTAVQALGDDSINNMSQPILIANIDTILLQRNFKKIEQELKKSNGFIDTFKAYDKSYSYLIIDKNDNVENIKEKIQISDLAASGLYGFNSEQEFLNCVNTLSEPVKNFSELYQNMINNGKKIKTVHNDQFKNTIVVGTPDQYLEFISSE